MKYQGIASDKSRRDNAVSTVGWIGSSGAVQSRHESGPDRLVTHQAEVRYHGSCIAVLRGPGPETHGKPMKYKFRTPIGPGQSIAAAVLDSK